MGPQFLPAFRAEISRCDIKGRTAPRTAFTGNAMGSPRIGHKDGSRKFRIRIKGQGQFKDMVVFVVCACFPGTDDKPAMGKTTMISLHFFLTDEVDRRIVVTEVVWHGYDSLCHSLSISTFFKDSKNFTRMFFPRRKFRVLAGTNRVKSGFHGNGVLLGVLDTGNAANRVTVALADAFAPEGIVLPYGKDGMAIDAGKGK